MCVAEGKGEQGNRNKNSKGGKDERRRKRAERLYVNEGE